MGKTVAEKVARAKVVAEKKSNSEAKARPQKSTIKTNLASKDRKVSAQKVLKMHVKARAFLGKQKATAKLLAEKETAKAKAKAIKEKEQEKKKERVLAEKEKAKAKVSKVKEEAKLL